MGNATEKPVFDSNDAKEYQAEVNGLIIDVTNTLTATGELPIGWSTVILFKMCKALVRIQNIRDGTFPDRLKKIDEYQAILNQLDNHFLRIREELTKITRTCIDCVDVKRDVGKITDLHGVYNQAKNSAIEEFQKQTCHKRKCTFQDFGAYAKRVTQSKGHTRNGKTVLIFGMMRTIYAEKYGQNDSLEDVRYYKAMERLGRDNIRIGQMLRRGYEVYTTSKSMEGDTIMKSTKHIDCDFTVPKFLDKCLGPNVPIDTQFHYVLDDWVYLPQGAYTEIYYKKGKWDNVLQLAKKGKLHDQCKVILPWRNEIIEHFFGSNQLAKKFTDAGFACSFLTKDPDQLVENPLWEASQADPLHPSLPIEEKNQVQYAVEEWLFKYHIPDKTNQIPKEIKDLNLDQYKTSSFVVFTYHTS